MKICENELSEVVENACKTKFAKTNCHGQRQAQALAVEICIDGNDPSAARHAARAALQGGATRVEVCRDMAHDGLTPSVAAVRAVRTAFGGADGLMVMARPRAGDFCYSVAEVQTTAAQIRDAAKAGADGVVLGALTGEGRVCPTSMRLLMRAAGDYGLTVTFHRAFDATPDAEEAVDTLIGLGVARILTSGCPWGSGGTALDGLSRLRRTITRAAGRIEIVLAGGITAATLPRLIASLPLGAGPVSVHAYSGAQTDGVTTTEAVRRLVLAARSVRK